MKINKLATIAATLLLSTSAFASQLITNGGFETGDFSGWTVSQTGYYGNNFYVSSTTNAPVSGYATPGAASGQFFAVSDQYGGGSQTLSQSFVTAANTHYTLSYDMFVSSHSGFDANNQFSRVDLLSAGNVINNFYFAAPNDSAYTHYSYDISSLVSAGGTYELRFMSLQNNFYQEQGVDNVSISGGNSVPEPVTLGLLGLGLLGLSFARRRAQ